jgi:hypothetical protein
MATLDQLKKKLAAKTEKIAKLNMQIKEERCAIAGIKDEMKAAKAPAAPAKPKAKAKKKK